MTYRIPIIQTMAKLSGVAVLFLCVAPSDVMAEPINTLPDSLAVDLHEIDVTAIKSLA